MFGEETPAYSWIKRHVDMFLIYIDMVIVNCMSSFSRHGAQQWQSNAPFTLDVSTVTWPKIHVYWLSLKAGLLVWGAGILPGRGPMAEWYIRLIGDQYRDEWCTEVGLLPDGKHCTTLYTTPSQLILEACCKILDLQPQQQGAKAPLGQKHWVQNPHFIKSLIHVSDRPWSNSLSSFPMPLGWHVIKGLFLLMRMIFWSS